MNLAFFAKQAWRVQQCPQARWVRFLKSIYFLKEDFLRVKKKGGRSWIWDSILKGRDLFLKGGKWVVGDGNTIRVWKDNLDI